MYYTTLSLYYSTCIILHYHCIYSTCIILHYHCIIVHVLCYIIIVFIILYSMENIAVPTDDMLQSEFYIPDTSDVPICSR